jgi:hypothetical protein
MKKDLKITIIIISGILAIFLIIFAYCAITNNPEEEFYDIECDRIEDSIRNVYLDIQSQYLYKTKTVKSDAETEIYLKYLKIKDSLLNLEQ